MKYCVLRVHGNGSVTVLFSSRFQWLAQLALQYFVLRMPGAEIEPAIINTSTQSVADLLERANDLQQLLWSMVSKNDDGAWATVHEADTPLAPAGSDAERRLARLLGH